MPQIHRGERDVVTVRVSPELNRKLTEYVRALGTTKTDVVAALIADKLHDVDIDDVAKDQERLPLSA